MLQLEDRDTGAAQLPLQSSPITFNYASSVPTTPYPELPPFPGSSSAVFASPAVSAASAPAGLGYNLIGAEPVGPDRLVTAREAGLFLRRCLEGVVRGTSGRDRIRLPSKIYILARDITGKVYNPVQIYYHFSHLRSLVKAGSSCGDSVFIGWPTEEEARECVAAAGLNWPSHVRD